MKSARPVLPRRMLARVAASGGCGALHVDATPGGTVYLADGRVTYVESPAAPGVGDLLTASGRLAAATWRAALDAGRDGARVGQLLVDQGHLTRGELELCVLGAIYDAAFFVLHPTPARVRFVADDAHWLGSVTQVDTAALSRETTRRRRLLDAVAPQSDVDTAPVVPVARPPVEQVVLTALQWEVLVRADGRRTAADIARVLGRAGYVVLQELRHLAAAGLVRARAATAGPVRTGDADAAAVPDPPVPEDDAGPPGTAPGGAGAATARPASTRRGTADRAARLPRRRPGARPPGEPDPADTPAVPSRLDEAVLSRIRTALESLP